MAARKRIASRRNWPANLRQNKQGYYWFQHPSPEPGAQKSFGLGKDFAVAAAQTRTANAEIERKKGYVTLLQRINGGEVPLHSFCETYESRRLDGKANSVVAMKSQIRAIKGAPFSGQAVALVKPKEIADFLKVCIAERGATMASNIRKRMLDVFREAISDGLVEVGKNPVDAIAKPKITVTRARLTLDDFKAIVAVARKDKERAWAANAMELALVTGQRREDIMSMKFAQARGGFLWIEQTKGTEGNTAKLKIPLSVKLNALGMSLEDVIKRCRDSVVSKNMIHFTRANGGAKPGGSPGLSTMSQTFARLRDEAEIAVADGSTPPSFHEIRSLAARLYAAEYGPAVAQAILGHKSSTMTDLYRDVRGREWIEVKLGAG